MIEQGILQLLGSDSGVKALVPSDISGNPQIYWLLAPKGAKPPYVVLSRVATEDIYTMAGATGMRAGLFQVSCFTDSKSGVTAGAYLSRSIALAVRKVLESFQGNLPDSDSTAVEGVFTEKDWDMPYQEGATGFTFQAMLQFRIWYLDTTFVLNDVLRGSNFPTTDGTPSVVLPDVLKGSNF